MEIVGFTISEYWPQREKRLGPGTIQVWMVIQYDGGVEEARAKAQEHLDLINEHWPERKPLLVELFAQNQGWETN